MAIPWLTILNTVPWSQVIRNAPGLAEAAGKLWKTVARWPGLGPIPAEFEAVPLTIEPNRHTLAEQRIAALEAGVSELNEQMLASSELIRAMAEQNSALIAAIEQARQQRLWMSATAALAVILAISALVFALLAARA